MQSRQPAHRTRRQTNLVLGLFAVGLLFTVATLAAAWRGRIQAQTPLQAKQTVVAELGLTDLCLFTEARYTRNPTQADLNTAFQDHPLSLDHFPSGSLIQPPQGIAGIR